MSDSVSYKTTKTMACGSCDGTMDVYGVFATGLPVVDPYMDYTYYPEKDEVLKFIHIKCNNCDFEQWS